MGEIDAELVKEALDETLRETRYTVLLRESRKPSDAIEIKPFRIASTSH